MARFLIDEDLPRSLSFRLQQRDNQSQHITDLELRGLPDAAVFAVPQKDAAILVSRDLGFANILQYPPGTHHGIVVARFPSALPGEALVAQVVELLMTVDAGEFEGSLIILEPGRARIRRSH